MRLSKRSKPLTAASIHTTSAIFRFSPPLNRKGSLQRRDGQSTKWWLILQCGADLGRYYREAFAQEHYFTRALQEPLWGTHASVIRGEEPPHFKAWKSLEGQKVEIHYSSQWQIHGSYVVLPAECNEALDYREQLALPREPRFPLHITIGNLKTQGHS